MILFLRQLVHSTGDNGNSLVRDNHNGYLHALDLKKAEGVNAKAVREDLEKLQQRFGVRLQGHEVQLAGLTQMFCKFVAAVQAALPDSVCAVSIKKVIVGLVPAY